MKIRWFKTSELENYRQPRRHKEYKKREKQDVFDMPIRFLFMKESQN